MAAIRLTRRLRSKSSNSQGMRLGVGEVGPMIFTDKALVKQLQQAGRKSLREAIMYVLHATRLMYYGRAVLNSYARRREP